MNNLKNYTDLRSLKNSYFAEVAFLFGLLSLGELLSAFGGDQIVGMVALVSSRVVVLPGQVILHDDGVVAPLENAGPLRKRHNLVSKVFFRNSENNNC